MEIDVKVFPKSAPDRFDGFDSSGILRAKLGAAPEKGKANKALADLFSSVLGIPKSSVSVIRGEKSRKKRVLLSDFEDESFLRAAAEERKK
ncbi:MAG: DUF167 domain-containing protein [Fibrobacterota bacterium]